MEWDGMERKGWAGLVRLDLGWRLLSLAFPKHNDLDAKDDSRDVQRLLQGRLKPFGPLYLFLCDIGQQTRRREVCERAIALLTMPCARSNWAGE